MITLTGRPIAKKNNYRSMKGRVFLSPAWKRWETNALWQLKSYKTKHTGLISVRYVFGIKGKYSVDLDNMIAGINDVLQKAEIIDDDKNIVSIKADKVSGESDWTTGIWIKDIKRT